MPLVKNLFYQTKEGDFELNIPEWSFSDTKISALTGPSGGGKTTLLKILCGLLPCPGLSWSLKGKEMSQIPPPERNLSVCFQDFRLFPHLSARQNILFSARAKGLSFTEIQKDFEEMIELLQLKKCLDLSIDKLSGGEKQRVALARSLIFRPDFLFLDEPFAWLDDESRSQARRLTAALFKKRSCPLLFISHNRADIEELADEEFVLQWGRIKKNLNDSPLEPP